MLLAIGLLVQWFSSFRLHQNHLESLSVNGPHSQISDSENIGLALRIFISNKFAGDVDAAVPGTIF